MTSMACRWFLSFGWVMIDDFAGTAHGRADDADHLVFGHPDVPKGIADQLVSGRIPQVIGPIDLRGDRAGENQLANLVPAQHNVEHFGIGQKLGLQLGCDHVVGRRQQGERGDLCPLQPVQEVVLAESGDRGHKDEHLGQHHEDRGQDQEASG